MPVGSWEAAAFPAPTSSRRSVRCLPRPCIVVAGATLRKQAITPDLPEGRGDRGSEIVTFSLYLIERHVQTGGCNSALTVNTRRCKLLPRGSCRRDNRQAAAERRKDTRHRVPGRGV
jgi:hypothetical protein